jgi:hypothetical protein
VWKALFSIEELTLAVMGCVVNGQESQARKYRLSSWNSEDPKAPVYVDGKLATILQENLILIYLHPRGLCLLTTLPTRQGFACSVSVGNLIILYFA